MKADTHIHAHTQPPVEYPSGKPLEAKLLKEYRYIILQHAVIALIARRLDQSPCLSFRSSFRFGDRRTRFTVINRCVTKVGPVFGNMCRKGRVARRTGMMMMFSK